MATYTHPDWFALEQTSHSIEPLDPMAAELDHVPVLAAINARPDGQEECTEWVDRRKCTFNIDQFRSESAGMDPQSKWGEMAAQLDKVAVTCPLVDSIDKSLSLLDSEIPNCLNNVFPPKQSSFKKK